jgi:dihydrofolate synthase/folylpolyglutamate synthase
LEYPDSIQALLSLVDYERSVSGPRQKVIVDLSRMERFLERLGDPHRRAATVHVAGTKGKGSTAAMCDSALRAAGHRTGFNSSPHMHHFRERIRLDTEPISESKFAALVEQVWPHREAAAGTGSAESVTLFEFITGMAFLCFAREQVGYQTVEVGLGGRLDATNVVEPDVAVITSISEDHTAILGSTLAAIAGEKAGIIKAGSTVVAAPQRPEAGDVIWQRCRELHAKVVQVGPEGRSGSDVTWRGGTASAGGQRLTVKGRLGEYDLEVPLLGGFQQENAATAVAALEVLAEQGHHVPAEAIVQGFARVSWPCRMEVVAKDPLVVIDGAHNPYSIEALLSSLPRYLPHRRLIVVAGFSMDKNVAQMVQRLCSEDPVVFATRSRHPRSLRPSAVAALFQRHGNDARVTPATEVALNQAMAAAGPEDLVLVTGSLFIAAEARESILGIIPERYPDLLPQDLRPV